MSRLERAPWPRFLASVLVLVLLGGAACGEAARAAGVDAGVARPAPPRSPPAGAAPAAPRPPAGHTVSPRATRVLVIGASSMKLALGAAFERELAAYEVHVHRFGKSGTGLSRPDELDWQAKSAELLAEVKPDLVIVNFGGNDAQTLELGGKRRAKFGTAEWDEEYGRRVTELVARLRAGGAQVAFIGMSTMRNEKLGRAMQKVNAVIRRHTEAAGGLYIDAWDLSAGPDGKYVHTLSVGGKPRTLRDEDGIHFTTWGGTYMVGKLMPRILRQVRLVPRDPARGLVERHGFTSVALGRPASYLVFRPRGAGPFPVLVLLHGSGGEPDTYSEQLHDELERAAERLGLVLVAPEGATAGDPGWWLDAPLVPHQAWASFVADEVLADVSAHLPVSAVRGLTGHSMGGHGALTLAIMRPGLFVSASSLSGVVDLTAAGTREALIVRLGPLDSARARWEERSAAQLYPRFPARARALALRLSCGRDDAWLAANRAFHAALEADGVPHDYDEAPGGHTWSYWRPTLMDHVAWHAAQLSGGKPTAAPR